MPTEQDRTDLKRFIRKVDGLHGSAFMEPWTNYFLGILIAAYRDFEGRTGALGGRGSKKALITTFIDSLMVAEFTIADVRQAAPGVSDGYINKLLGELKKAGKIDRSARVAGPVGAGSLATDRTQAARAKTCSFSHKRAIEDEIEQITSVLA